MSELSREKRLAKWLKYLIKDMNTAMTHPLGFYPQESTVKNLREIKSLVESSLQAKEKPKCPVCGGDGEIQGEVDYDNNDVPIWNLEKCPECGGVGYQKKTSEAELEEFVEIYVNQIAHSYRLNWNALREAIRNRLMKLLKEYDKLRRE